MIFSILKKLQFTIDKHNKMCYNEYTRKVTYSYFRKVLT